MGTSSSQAIHFASRSNVQPNLMSTPREEVFDDSRRDYPIWRLMTSSFGSVISSMV